MGRFAIPKQVQNHEAGVHEFRCDVVKTVQNVRFGSANGTIEQALLQAQSETATIRGRDGLGP